MLRAAVGCREDDQLSEHRTMELEDLAATIIEQVGEELEAKAVAQPAPAALLHTSADSGVLSCCRMLSCWAMQLPAMQMLSYRLCHGIRKLLEKAE